MTFDVSAEAYDRFMGRFSRPLAALFADFAGVRPGFRALDVGCGAGALTTELVGLLGADKVAAVDPSPQLVEETRVRLPGVDVRLGDAESLPFADATFDVAHAQLVVSFMDDPERGVREMRRVVRADGVVALCMWDLERMEMLVAVARARRRLHPDAPPGRDRYRTEPELRALLEGAGLREVETDLLSVESEYSGFDELWEPLLAGAGPAGSFVRSLDEEDRAALRRELHRQVGEPTGSFTLGAKAWGVRGRG